MTDKVTYVYLRLSADARHSKVDFDAIESLAAAPLQHDRRDPSVYFFALPDDIHPASAHKIISDLVTTPHIDEAWHDSESPAVITPQLRPE